MQNCPPRAKSHARYGASAWLRLGVRVIVSALTYAARRRTPPSTPPLQALHAACAALMDGATPFYMAEEQAGGPGQGCGQWQAVVALPCGARFEGVARKKRVAEATAAAAAARAVLRICGTEGAGGADRGAATAAKASLDAPCVEVRPLYTYAVGCSGRVV